ncbi:NB-ARC - like 10 [Theobroma cacao]|nr:NB-ARC - like 10 [Theobroma cacao]
MAALLAAFVVPIWDLAKIMWNSISNRADYIRDVGNNLESLEYEMERLRRTKEDVEARLDCEENEWFQRTHEVTDWLERVQRLEASVEEIIEEGKEEVQKKYLGGFCLYDCCSSNQAGKKVSETLKSVAELITDSKFDVLVPDKPRDLVDERPERISLGLATKLDQVWRWIEDPSVGIIGIYGMGGVGKTTLLKKVNNKFLDRSHSFKPVMWILVSKDAEVERVQELIRNELNIPDRVWENQNVDGKAAEIFRVLRRKTFVLLLDDLWERLDIMKLGVPIPDNANGSKIIFTTRSEEVCGRMEAHRRLKVECLPPDVALDLFRTKVGEDVLNSHPEIPKLAELAAQECKGLPLALITIARAMASRKTPQEWKHAIKLLQSYPSEFSGMGDHVFPILRFSYDSLSDDTVKKCFLYCCVFPEDHDIEKNELVELWIGKGFLDKFDNIYDARNEGEFIVGSLKLACLLEDGVRYSFSTKHVMMHDVIRDMALWLACENGKKENNILVQDHVTSVKAHGLTRWKEAVRASLWGTSFTSLSETPFCPHLQTLLVGRTHLRMFPTGFFHLMLALRVLNLSENEELRMLPEGIGELINLHYLNLSLTSIGELPVGIKNLKNLKILLLDDTYFLTKIPKEAISSLSSLTIFSMFFYQGYQSLHGLDEFMLAEELGSLENLNELSITLSFFQSILKLLESLEFPKCIRRLSIGCKILISLEIPSPLVRSMEHLERLELKGCYSLEELIIYPEHNEGMEDIPPFLYNSKPMTGHECFRNLSLVDILLCSMVNLTWLAHAPLLQTLLVSRCNLLTEVIREDFSNGATEEYPDLFSNLTTLYLSELPSLDIFYSSRSVPALMQKILLFLHVLV